MNNIYPRVLVITGEPFNYESATGITISNLFEGWPKDRISQIYSAKIQPTLNICENIWQFNNTDLYVIALFNNLLGKVNIWNNYNDPVIKNGVKSSNKSQQSMIRRWVIPWVDLLPYHFSIKFYRWLEEFKPQLIYSTLGSIRLVNTVQRISRYLKIPIVPHFMDDWLTTYSVDGKSIVTTLQRIIIQNMTRGLLKDVPFGFGICDAMATEYSQRYQRHFDSFMNPVEVIPERFVSKKEVKGSGKPVRFVYVGGLHLSRYRNLKDIGNVIIRLRKEGHNIELHIYAPRRDLMEHGSFLALENGVRVCGTLSPNDVQKTICEYDVAVHVESFSKNPALYTRLSMSTKIPQYFAAGLPVLAYGPAELASCRYVHDNGCGKVVGKRDPKALAKAIRELASNQGVATPVGKKFMERCKRTP